MAYFQKDFLDFFIELAPNNHKDWFDENRKRYENSVKEPFKNFVTHIISKLDEIDSSFSEVEAKDCIFRINRDVRFAKDKQPYKTQVSAIVTPSGKKSKAINGVYFELGPEHLGVYTGVYMPDKEQIDRIRRHIAKNGKRLEAILNEKHFKATFGEVKGEKAKLLPADSKLAATQQPLIFNKQFYLQHTAEPEIIVEKDVLKYIAEKYRHAKAFNDFIKEVL